jgi:hypothetical protein
LVATGSLWRGNRELVGAILAALGLALAFVLRVVGSPALIYQL